MSLPYCIRINYSKLRATKKWLTVCREQALPAAHDPKRAGASTFKYGRNTPTVPIRCAWLNKFAYHL